MGVTMNNVENTIDGIDVQHAPAPLIRNQRTRMPII